MGDTVTAELSNGIHWTVKLEDYFASTGEKAHCLSWVHKKSEELYSTRKTFIDLPVIVGSGVIAFLNAGSSSMFSDPKISSVALGIGSLVVGIMNTMGTYFGWARRAEGHRISAIHYAKLFRFIAIEMSLPREERMSPHDLLKLVKDQYDRLAEISPMVPSSVIQTFRKNFDKYTDISKPEEANGLEKISIFKPSDEEPFASKRSSTSFSNDSSANSTPFVIANPMLMSNMLKPKQQVTEKYIPSLQVMNSIEKSIKIPALKESLVSDEDGTESPPTTPTIDETKHERPRPVLIPTEEETKE